MDKRKQPHSVEHKRKISEAQKGIPKLSVRGELNGAKTPEARLKISLALKGKKKSPEHIEKNRLARLGKKASDETRRKMSLSAPKGEKNHNWKGGITGWQKSIRQSSEYFLWRKSVFERDDYTCIFCGYKSYKRINGKSDIHADHIKPFALYPELRFAIDNGRTLCIDCHRKTETYGNKPIYLKPV